MPADPRIYNSDRLAHCYANDRPPVHPAICARMFAALRPCRAEVNSALDVGCGAGASTAALVSHSRHVTGVDPFPGMLRHAKERLPTSTFLQGTAEAMPVDSEAFDLVTAAGSLNYADVHLALAEAWRVLSPGGYFAAYDFSSGRVLLEDPLAASCFLSFEQRFPWPKGYPLNLQFLPYQEHALALALYEEFVVELPMSADAYIRYIMSETNVEAAIANGTSEGDARDACRSAFGPLLVREPLTVRFRAVLALAKKDS
jgi:ubiquinone/menaquinone biosynthesis C-methylase UbiE